MEKLKKLEEICSPDNRTRAIVIISHETEEKREYGIKDHYEQLELVTLHDIVPEEVRSQFNVARNVCLYSWFCYAFHNVSCMKAYSTIEQALRIRLNKGDTRVSFKAMLQEALKKGLLKDEQLPEMIPDLRNRTAHGSPMNANWSMQVLRMSADMINQLFAGTDTKSDI